MPWVRQAGWRLAGRVLALALALATGACAGITGDPEAPAIGGLTDPLHAIHDLSQTTGSIRPAPPVVPVRGITAVGDDLFVSDALPGGQLFAPAGKNDVTLNLVDVDIASAAKTVIGDILGQSLAVDEKVTGTVTLQTIRPVSRSMLADMFEAVLTAKGYALVRSNGGYRVIADVSGKLPAGSLPVGIGGRGAGPGLSAQVIPLRYVSAEDMRNLLASVAPREAVLMADAARNFIIVSGTRAQVSSILETVALFDVDWMRGMSAAIFPLKSSNPAAIAEELEQLFGSAGGPLRGTIKFLPNTHLNAVLVITSRAEYLRRARELIGRLETMAMGSEAQFFVYKVQNRSAKDLAEVLRSMVAQSNGASAGLTGISAKFTAKTYTAAAPGFGKPADGAGGAGGAPGADPAAPGGNGGLSSGGSGPAAGASPDPDHAGSGDVVASSRSATVSDLGSLNGGAPNGGDGGAGAFANMTISADDENNSIIVTGTRLQYNRVLRILTTLDAAPIQVLLEATIAEVTLNDELKFGVRWFLNQHHYKLSQADDATTSNAATILSGLNFATKLAQIDSLLNMLSSITNVRVVSTPSLTVLDNHVAHLQVGDEVPIIKQSATSTASNTAATVTDVEYKNTGVILSVTPRVNQNGLVLLDIDQEVSGVTKTTTSGINSPTVQQRKVSTTVIVEDGQALALGGLVQDKQIDDRERLPLAGRVPIVGSLLGSTDNQKERTELIVFVRPRVLRNVAEARGVTDEFRGQLDQLLLAQKRNAWKTDIGHDLNRIGH